MFSKFLKKSVSSKDFLQKSVFEHFSLVKIFNDS